MRCTQISKLIYRQIELIILVAVASTSIFGQTMTVADLIEGSPVIDARYVGIKCDGVTDDGPAISAAIAQAGAAGSKARQIKFQSGTCRINNTIHVIAQHPWALIGDTPTSGINDFSNSTQFLFYGGGTPLLQFDYDKKTSVTSASVTNNVATVKYSALPTANFVNGTSVFCPTFRPAHLE